MNSTQRYTSPLCSCVVCQKLISQRGIHSHYLANHGTEEQQRKQKSGIGHGAYKSVTAQHSKKIKMVELYKSNPNYCTHCNNELEYPKRKNKFCSSVCAASHNNKLRPTRTSASKLKTSVSLKSRTAPFTRVKFCSCEVCGNSFMWNSVTKGSNRFCSSVCQNTHISVVVSNRLKNPIYRKTHNYGRGKRSWMETSFETWLNENNVSSFSTETHFWNHETNKNIFVDFLFEDLKLIIELDGTQHRNTVEKDRIRDKFLTSVGYNVVRISYNDYKKQTRLDEIKQLVGIP